MTTEKPFPLIVWEQTLEYQQQLADSQSRFQEVAQQIVAKGMIFGADSSEVVFTDSAVPVVWRNPNRPLRVRWTVEDALRSARRYGDTGYFRVEDFQDFLVGEGFIVEEAMYDMGFRRDKRNSRRWVKRQKTDMDLDPYLKKYQLLFENEITEVDKSEAERLTALMPVANTQVRPGETFKVSVDRKGLIFISLEVDPFAGHSAESISLLGMQLAQKAHLAQNQEVFLINATNIKFPESERNHDVVYIKALREGEMLAEVVWPAIAERQSLYPLAQDLRDRILLKSRFGNF